jgi:Protein of unknown function (DUF2796)
VKILIVIFMTAIFSRLAVSAEEHAHREHKAHKHGAASLSIAFDGDNGEIDFEAPGESIYGFEYAPKKETDKKRQLDGVALLENNLSAMIQFDPSLKCNFTKKNVQVEREKNSTHSAVHAEFNVACAQSPVGKSVIFYIQRSFPKLKDVDLKLIADDLQTSAEIKKDGQKLEIKK